MFILFKDKCWCMMFGQINNYLSCQQRLLKSIYLLLLLITSKCSSVILCICVWTDELTARCWSDKWVSRKGLMSIIKEPRSPEVKDNPPMKLHWMHSNSRPWQYRLTLGVAVTDLINRRADVAHSWLSTFRNAHAGVGLLMDCTNLC